jgi:hypothetical protein
MKMAALPGGHCDSQSVLMEGNQSTLSVSL